MKIYKTLLIILTTSLAYHTSLALDYRTTTANIEIVPTRVQTEIRAIQTEVAPIQTREIPVNNIILENVKIVDPCLDKYEKAKANFESEKINQDQFMASLCDKDKGKGSAWLAGNAFKNLGKNPLDESKKYDLPDLSKFASSSDSNAGRDKSPIIPKTILNTNKDRTLPNDNSKIKVIYDKNACTTKLNKLIALYKQKKLTKEQVLAQICSKDKAFAEAMMNLDFPDFSKLGENQDIKWGGNSTSSKDNSQDTENSSDIGQSSQLNLQGYMNQKSKALEILNNISQKISSLWGGIIGNIK